MEGRDRRYDLVPVGKAARLMPVLAPAKPLQFPALRRSMLSALAQWMVSEPVVRLGVATIAFTAGAFLSKRWPVELPRLPVRIQQRGDEAGEWLVTGIGLSVQSGWEQVSAWSIAKYRIRR